MVKRRTNIDYIFLLVVLALLLFGFASLYSASTVESYNNFGNTTYYIIHQVVYGGVLGLAALYIFSKIDYHFWQKNLPWLIFLTLFLLAIVKLPILGISYGGATRWLRVGPVSFQPAELAKLVVIFYLASWADRKKTTLNNFYFGLLPSLTIVVLFAVLILWQPDLGTMIVLLVIAFIIWFAAGTHLRYLFWTAVSGILAVVALIKFEPYRARRLTTFLNPGIDPRGISYHINQALLAIGSGGLWGYGYGLSRQKHNYLPEGMGDSMFAVLAEELGFVRVMLIIFLFVAFALKGFSIARSAPDAFGRLTALGITSWIVFQVIINIGAMVNLLPLTGIPLPFFSYGSTALIMNLAAVGIMLNISKQTS